MFRSPPATPGSKDRREGLEQTGSVGMRRGRRERQKSKMVLQLGDSTRLVWYIHVEVVGNHALSNEHQRHVRFPAHCATGRGQKHKPRTMASEFPANMHLDSPIGPGELARQSQCGWDRSGTGNKSKERTVRGAVEAYGTGDRFSSF